MKPAHFIRKLGVACVLGALLSACPPVSAAAAIDVDTMLAIQRGDLGALSPTQRAAAVSGANSAKISGERALESNHDAQFSLEQAKKFEQTMREAFVAALPPRDQARGKAVLLGDGNVSGRGRLLYFVSRSMPISLLRAYALESVYTGGLLVVKGLRKGDTVNEFLMEALDDFNSADGVALSAMMINPNLFDMFGVEVVPAVVWSARPGLEETGSGCEDLAIPVRMHLAGPNDTAIEVDKPACAPLPESSYYKLTGAVTTWYALEQFEAAGAPKAAMAEFKGRLAEQQASAAAGGSRGKVQNGLSQEADLSQLPRSVFEGWHAALATQHVTRTPYGPLFSDNGAEDPVYRQELKNRIEKITGLR